MRSQKAETARTFTMILTVVMAGLLFGGCPDSGGNRTGEEGADAGTEQVGEAQNGSTANAGQTGGAQRRLGSRDAIPVAGNKDAVNKYMASISGAEVRIDTTTQNGEGLAYKGGRFGGFPVIDWTFRFFRGQMLFGQVNINAREAGVPVDDIYQAMSNMLTDWYGDPVITSDIKYNRLEGFNEQEQQFLSKVGSSLYGDFKVWSVGDQTKYLATVNKVQWNQAGGDWFVHVAFYDRARNEEFFSAMGE